jgi:hypothetical protein
VFARWVSGFAGTFGNTSFSIAIGTVADEDIQASSGGTKTACRLWYRNTGAASMTFESNVAYPWKNNSGPQYDNAGTLAAVGTNKFFNSWVYATTDIDYPIYIVVGQTQHNTVALARNEAQPTIQLTTAEWKLLYRATYQESGGSAIYIEAADYRQISTGPATGGYTPTSHLGLTDIGANTHVQIDAHLSSTSNPHSVTAAQLSSPTAPGAGLLNVVGIGNGESAYGHKAIFDTTDPADVGTAAAAGTALVAARRDHVHKGGAGESVKESVTVTHAFAAGDVVYRKAGTPATWEKAKADAVATAEALGVIESVSTTVSFVVVYSGKISGLSGLTDGSVYFLSATTAGALTDTEPSTVGYVSRPILVATSTTTGIVMQYRGMVVPGTPTPVANGGTGVTTLASNGVLYGNGTSAVQALAVNSTSTPKALTQVSSGAPAWVAIGEKITWSSAPSSQSITTAETDWTNASIAMSAGTWLIVANLSVSVFTASGQGAGAYAAARLKITDTANNVIDYKSFVGSSAATTSAEAEFTGTVGFSMVKTFTESTTYKIRVLNDRTGGGNSGSLRNQNGLSSEFFAVRLA